MAELDERLERVARALAFAMIEQVKLSLVRGCTADGAQGIIALAADRDAVFALARAALSAMQPRDEGLEALRELSERATKGEWAATGLVVFPKVTTSDPVAVCQRAIGDAWDQAAANTRLIAAAVNYVRNKLAAGRGGE